MDQAEKLSITLPAALARLVREKVEAGDYASNSEVIRVALRAWQEREMERAEHLKRLRREIAEAVDDPRPSIPASDVFDGLRARHGKAVKARRRAK